MCYFFNGKKLTKSAVASLDWLDLGIYMKRIYLIVFSIIFFSSSVIGKEYGDYDPMLILTVSESTSGKKHGLDLKYLDKMLTDLSFHAANYPPRFDNPQDRQRAIKDINVLSGMMDILVNGPNPNPQFLWRVGSLQSMGHNLELSGSAEKANANFKKLLDINPYHPRGNYMYGLFLAGAGKPEQALPYLEKALDVGVSSASYSIGMVYLTLGDKQKAIENFTVYQKQNPSDSNINKLLDDLQNDKVKITKVKN